MQRDVVTAKGILLDTLTRSAVLTNSGYFYSTMCHWLTARAGNTVYTEYYLVRGTGNYYSTPLTCYRCYLPYHGMDSGTTGNKTLDSCFLIYRRFQKFTLCGMAPDGSSMPSCPIPRLLTPLWSLRSERLEPNSNYYIYNEQCKILKTSTDMRAGSVSQRFLGKSWFLIIFRSYSLEGKKKFSNRNLKYSDHRPKRPKFMNEGKRNLLGSYFFWSTDRRLDPL